MRQGFAVSTGSYSDYHVLAVCATRDQADELCALYNAGSSYGEAYVEDDIPFLLEGEQPEVFQRHTVAVEARVGLPVVRTYSQVTLKEQRRPEVNDAYTPPGAAQNVAATGTDLTACIKAAKDRAAQVLAETVPA